MPTKYENENYNNLRNENDIKIKITVGKTNENEGCHETPHRPHRRHRPHRPQIQRYLTLNKQQK